MELGQIVNVTCRTDTRHSDDREVRLDLADNKESYRYVISNGTAVLQRKEKEAWEPLELQGQCVMFVDAPNQSVCAIGPSLKVHFEAVPRLNGKINCSVREVRPSILVGPYSSR